MDFALSDLGLNLRLISLAAERAVRYLGPQLSRQNLYVRIPTRRWRSHITCAAAVSLSVPFCRISFHALPMSPILHIQHRYVRTLPGLMARVAFFFGDSIDSFYFSFRIRLRRNHV
jgi:hypothetical protein